jgi:hypothetical protein
MIWLNENPLLCLLYDMKRRDKPFQKMIIKIICNKKTKSKKNDKKYIFLTIQYLQNIKKDLV